MLQLSQFVIMLTSLSWETPKMVIGKQYTPLSDAAEHGIWSESTLFALNTGISIKPNNNES